MKKEHIYRIISILIGILLALFIGEICARIYYFGKHALSYTVIKNFCPLGETDFIEMDPDFKRMYTLKPNIDSYFKGVRFKTNSAGQRDKEYVKRKPKNTIRGIVLGDSFTMGSGVEEEDVYHSVIERQLNEEDEEVNVELINFGVGGYNLMNYLGLMKTSTLEYRPDFILIGFCAFNDFDKPKRNQNLSKIPIKRKKSENRFWKSYLRVMFKKSNLWKEQESTRWTRELNTKDRLYLSKTFKSYAAFQKTHKIKIFINYLSYLNDIDNLNILKQIAKKHNLTVVDSYGKFDYQNIRKYQISEMDAHPNHKANELFARALLDSEVFKSHIQRLKQNI